jgi:hypothetical protein
MDVAVPAQKDHRERIGRADERLLQLETAQSAELQVDDRTTLEVRLACQKRLRGAERFHIETGRVESAWPRPHGPSNGPAIYLDAADTSALITELAGIQRETAGLGGVAIVRAESGAARSVEDIAKDLVAGKTTKSAPAPSETRMDEVIQRVGRGATVRA